MVLCPECDSDLDVEEDELDEGEVVSCAECGSDFEVVGVEPLELTKVSDEIDEEELELKDLDEDSDTFFLEIYSQSTHIYNSATAKGGWE